MKKQTKPKIAFSQDELGELYLKHLPMAVSIAQKFSKKYGVWFDPLRDEALSLLGLIISRWHEGGQGQAPYNGRCSPTTWIYRILWWQLQTWVRQQTKPIVSFTAAGITPGAEDDRREPALKPTYLQKLLRSLGSEAQFLVRTIVNAPWELADDITSRAPRHSICMIRRYLEKTCGWTAEKIDSVWTEVEECLA